MKFLLLAALTVNCLFSADGVDSGISSSGVGESTVLVSATTTLSTCGTQLKNIYYHGFNLQTSTVSNAAACCDLCSAYDGCVMYTYFYSSSTGESLCYGAISSSVTAVPAFIVSATTAPTPTTTSMATPATPTPSRCNEQLEGVFYNDYTIYEFSIDSTDKCCDYCAQLATEGCVLYTLYVSKSENVKRCLLKSAVGTTTNYTNSDDLTVFSAFIPASATVTPTPTTECVVEGQYCGNAQGTTCCESDSYCQPWNTYYYSHTSISDTRLGQAKPLFHLDKEWATLTKWLHPHWSHKAIQ